MTTDASNINKRIAIYAELLYLANLTVAPGIAFLALIYWWRRHSPADSLARSHINMALRLSVLAGGLLLLVSLLIVWLGGLHQPATWIVLILYVMCCHSALILIGVVGLTQAMAGKPFALRQRTP